MAIILTIAGITFLVGTVALLVYMVRETLACRRAERFHQKRRLIYRIRERAAKRERRRVFGRARQIEHALRHQIAGVN